MRSMLVVVTLFAFGCAELRYPTRTQMIEVTPDPAVVAQPMPPPPPSSPQARRARGRGFIIGGTIASALGVALVLGGALGLQKQEADNAAAAAQCNATGSWFCGSFDDLSYLPYIGLLTIGGASLLTGLVLFGVGANRLQSEPAE